MSERPPPPVGSPADHERFGRLTFDDFRRLARDETLSEHERIGFPGAYRRGHEAAIAADIEAKLPALLEQGRTVVDIGPGASELPRLIERRCAAHGHRLIMVDSAEMLAHHPDAPHLTKVAARFPDCEPLLAEQRGTVDAVLAYSVLHYAFADASVFAFLDAVLGLLAPGGAALIGDIPNASMRRRFLASAAGAQHHRAYSGRDEDPTVRFNEPDPGQIDDAVVIALASRARAAGFHAWIVAQAPHLPLANRREDLLIARP